MKVGTDGVLLGAWASDIVPRRILDVGTGTGLISLMMAQRFPEAEVLGVDIDEASIEQARENVKSSPFEEQINIEKQDFQHIDSFSNQYDLIVSNPPFYQEETLGGNKPRDAARHTVSLPFETLIKNSEKLLSEEGLFSVIIPYQSAADFISTCALHLLYLTRRTDVRSNERKPFKRTLLEFGRSIHPVEACTMILYDAENQRTAAYTELTKDFYI